MDESNVRQATIEKLNHKIATIEYTLRENDLLEYQKIMMRNDIDELKKEIGLYPHYNFLFEPNKLNWPSLCSNRKAMRLLQDAYHTTPENIHLEYLFANPSIFVLDRGDPSYPSELPTRFRSSSGNMLLIKPGAKSAPAKKPVAKSAPAKKPVARSAPAKISTTLKSLLPSTPLTPRSLNSPPHPVPSPSRDASNDMATSSPLTPRSSQ